MPLSRPIPAAVAPTALSLRRISKRFGSVRALTDVSLDFAAAQIHAVLGENGAGKSTLMNVLGGVQPPDSGEIQIGGIAVSLPSPRAARRHGIGMVHQHFTLVDALTVAENLALSFALPGEWRFDALAALTRAQRFAESIGLTVDSPEARVSDLPVGARQRLEILKALAGDVRVLILDEPTAVLTPQESDQLFAILKRLRQQGTTILFITHKLREVMATADTITILRRGEVVGTHRVGELDETQLAKRMIGESAVHQPTSASPATLPKDRGLSVGALSLIDGANRKLLDEIDLRVAAGQILGIAGVDGNGQEPLFDVLVGLRRPDAGAVSIDGTAVEFFSPADALRAGIGHIPPDRHRQGLILAMSVRDNCILHRGLLDRMTRSGWLDERAVDEFAATVVREYEVQHASMTQPVRALSGGNQQRIVVGRELALEPRVLIAVNPTRGLDIAATTVVGNALRSAARRGCAVLLISTDVDEVLGLSDAVRVLFRGRLGPELRAPIDLQQLGLRMAGAA